MNQFTFHYPYADSFVTPGVNVTGVFYGHMCICGVKAARMFVIESLSRSDKHFPERPVRVMCCTLHDLKNYRLIFFRSVGRRCLPNPLAFCMRFFSCFNPFGVAGPLTI